MQTARDLRVEYRFDHEDQFRAAFPTVDDRRGVFRVRRDITDLSDERVWHSVNRYPSRITVVDRTNLRFGGERAHLDVLRREQRGPRVSPRHPFSLERKRGLKQNG